MGHWFLDPLLAGLSMGLFCCLSCYPFLAPVFAAGNRTPQATFSMWIQFILGRLAGYVLLGAAMGALGKRFGSAGLGIASILGMMAMAGLTFARAFRPEPATACRAGVRRVAAVPVLLGFLMGFHACPPVLMSAAYVFHLQSILKGMVYFFVFFCATTVYLIPLFFVGLLGRMREFRLAARISAFLVGALFLVQGLWMLNRQVLLLR